MRFTLAISLLFFVSVTYAQEIDFYATTISFSDTAIQFDTLMQGDTTLVAFTIKNTGKKDLIIRQVWPSCGCSVVKLDKDTLSSNDETILWVQFDSHGKKGDINNYFEVFSNGSGGYQILRLTGYVKEQD